MARVMSRIPGFQVPFADRVRREASVPSMAVGLILTGRQAENILSDGRADLICIAREALRNPHWACTRCRMWAAIPNGRCGRRSTAGGYHAAQSNCG